MIQVFQRTPSVTSTLQGAGTHPHFKGPAHIFRVMDLQFNFPSASTVSNKCIEELANFVILILSHSMKLKIMTLPFFLNQ